MPVSNLIDFYLVQHGSGTTFKMMISNSLEMATVYVTYDVSNMLFTSLQ